MPTCLRSLRRPVRCPALPALSRANLFRPGPLSPRYSACGPVGRPPLLLAGDLTYGADILQRGQLPGVGRRRRLSQSTRQVVALEDQQPGLVVLPAHDPTAAQRLLDS